MNNSVLEYFNTFFLYGVSVEEVTFIRLTNNGNKRLALEAYLALAED